MFKPGDVLYFHPEGLTILVVMANNTGIRYIDPLNPQFDDIGNIRTTYVANEVLMEWTSRLGNMADIVREGVEY